MKKLFVLAFLFIGNSICAMDQYDYPPDYDMDACNMELRQLHAAAQVAQAMGALFDVELGLDSDDQDVVFKCQDKALLAAMQALRKKRRALMWSPTRARRSTSSSTDQAN